jgi:hypothetical protein
VKMVTVTRAFDPETDAKSWGTFDMGSMFEKQNKKKGIASKKVVVKQANNVGLVRVRNDIRLQLTNDIDFSLTRFEKPNKGFSNQQKVNCFMNVVLQSVLACPAMFNLLQAIGSNESVESLLVEDGLLKKLVSVSKHFDSARQIDINS